MGPELPRRVTSLVGRERELDEIAAELRRTRLLTLTGAGGCGKTTLALEAARRAAGDFPDGAWWVELAHLADADAVAPTVALALDVQPLPGQSELGAVAAYLASRRALIVLDNCEHLLDRCADVVQTLLLATDDVTVLATSRAPLALAAESDWRVPSLSPPEAVQLFVERGAKVRSRFALTVDNASAAADVCTRLDGIPLAIELAAARLRVLSPEQIASGLDDALTLVAGGARAALPRHRTLRASIEWSHALLDDRQQVLLRRLGVFAGSCSLPLVEAVCVDDELPAAGVLEALSGLVEHSLAYAEDAGGALRYRLLETVRHYALERLAAAGELDALRDRHRDSLLAFAEHQGAEIISPRQPQAFAVLDLEAPNLAAAIDRALETDPEKAQRLCVALGFWLRYRGRMREGIHACRAALAAAGPEPSPLRARTLGVLAWILMQAGELEEAYTHAQSARTIGEALADDAAIEWAHVALIDTEVFRNPTGAAAEIERSVAFARRIGSDWLLVRSAMLLAALAWFRQDRDACRAHLADHWQRLERVGDHDAHAYAYFCVGGSCYATLEHEVARRCFARTMALASAIQHPVAESGGRIMTRLLDAAAGDASSAVRDIVATRELLHVRGGIYYMPWVELILAITQAACGDLRSAAEGLDAVVAGRFGEGVVPLTWAEAELAEVQRLRGDPASSREHAAAALERARGIANPWNAAQSQLVLGRLAAADGEWAEAERLHHDALGAIVERRLRLELPRALEGLAEIAAGRESYDDAARVLGMTQRFRDEQGPVAWPARRTEIDALAGRIREALGETRFAEASREGASLDEAGAIAWLRRARGERRRPSVGWESLTPTEVEVVRHVAAGLTNPQVAERMFVSRATVKTHLAHIYAKLGLSNRAELASEATRRCVGAPAGQPLADTSAGPDVV